MFSVTFKPKGIHRLEITFMVQAAEMFDLGQSYSLKHQPESEPYGHNNKMHTSKHLIAHHQAQVYHKPLDMKR